MIGIFWVYKGTVFGETLGIEGGQENVPGLIDSPDSHTDFWDRNREFKRLFPELRSCEYQEVPRGRVLYSKDDQKAIVYMDKVLFSDSTKQIIMEFFKLDESAISWRRDPHLSGLHDHSGRDRSFI